MAAIRGWVTRFCGALGTRRRDAELEQELRLHLELAAEDERRRAAPGADTRRAAVIRLGGVAPAMDALRDQRGLPWFDDLVRDLRHGLRALRRNPLFATVVLLTLAIGIGANTAVFSVLNSVLLKPPAYPHAEELVAVWHTAPGAAGLSTVSGDPAPPPHRGRGVRQLRAGAARGWGGSRGRAQGAVNPGQSLPLSYRRMPALPRHFD